MADTSNSQVHVDGQPSTVVTNDDGGQPSSVCTTPTNVSSKRKPPRPPKTKVKRTRKPSTRKPSVVWDHFDKFLEDNYQMGRCKYCKTQFLADPVLNGTSSMLTHMITCKGYARELEDGQQTLAIQPKKGEIGFSLVATSFTQEGCRKFLAEMIIIDELPFRFAENIGFRRYSNYVCPKFKNMPSRFTVARDVLQIYHDEKEILKKSLKGRRVCLTTDTWTSIQNLNYMCLTCHFVDDNWILHKRIINFCQVDDHKGDTIGKKIESCLLEWNIDSIFTLTVDNASSNSTTIKYLQRVTKDWKGTILGHEFLHMRCCAHILNLIVSDGLKEHDDSICKVRDAIRYVKSSPNRFVVFKNCVDKLKLGDTGKGLVCLDVPTRWNSTYLMLERAQNFFKAFDRMVFDDPKYKEYLHNQPPTEDDWDKCTTFVKFLKLFYLATKRFSGSLYVTSNTFFDEIFLIKSEIERLRKGDDSLALMATNMKLKFDKYWGNGDKINLLLYVSVLLDPRKKLEYLEWCFMEMYGSENVDLIHDLVVKVKDAFVRLFDCYASLHLPKDKASNESVTSRMKVEDEHVDPRVVMASKFQKYLVGKQSSGCTSKVEKYLSEACEVEANEGFDILGWWKINSSRYQVLAQVARDVLAVPVSTVASESAFSTGGRILDPFRSSLSPSMVEALVCAQNWLKSSVPISIRKLLDAIEEFEDEYDSVVPDVETPSTTESLAIGQNVTTID